MKNFKKTLKASAALAISLVMILLATSCADKSEPDEGAEGSVVTLTTGSAADTAETDTDTDTDTDSDTDSDTDTDTETETDTDTDTEADSETEKTPETKAEGKTPAVTQATKNEEYNVGGGSSGNGGSGGSSGQNSGGSSGTVTTSAPPETQSAPPVQPSTPGTDSGLGIQTGTGGNLHCYPDAPSIEYEDTSNTLPFMPLRQEGATDPGASYNRPFLKRDQIYPGLVVQGNENFSTTYVGYDGFLFCGDTMSDYDGTSLYTQDRLNSLVKGMVKRNDWVESVGKKMYIVFIPNKNSIYPEYMPPGYTMGSYRRIDQMTDALRAAGIKVINGKEALLAAKNANPARSLYYKTDTHWNNHGGYEVYKQLIAEIQKDFPGTVFHPRSDYQINYAETFMKDQAWYLGYYDATSELGPVYTLKSGRTARFGPYQKKDTWGVWQFCYKWPNGYSDHLYYYSWTNDYNAGAPNMYMLRDSYSVALAGFLKDSFHTSTYNWSFYFSKSAILNSGADVIIIEAVEKDIQPCIGTMPLSK